MTDNIVIPTAAQAPEWYKASKPSHKFQALDPSESLAEGIGQSYAVIGYKGKNWSIRYRGVNHILLRPDDGTPTSYIDVIILRAAKLKAKSYYESWEEGAVGKRPVCASIDGVRPDPDVQDQQNDLCATCKRNEWHTDTNGRKSRDCQDYKRLAVLILPNQSVRALGEALLEPAFLRVPPDSLNDLAVFGDNMAAQGWPFSSFITRISFDSTKAHPKFLFKALQALTDDEAALVLPMREEPLAKRITGEADIAARAGIASAPARAPAPAPQLQAQAAPPTPPPLAVAGVEAEANPGLGVFAAPPNPGPITLPSRQPATIEMAPGPGGAFAITPPPEPQAAVHPGAMVGQTADDVGAAAEDPDLDAKIAAMLG